MGGQVVINYNSRRCFRSINQSSIEGMLCRKHHNSDITCRRVYNKISISFGGGASPILIPSQTYCYGRSLRSTSSSFNLCFFLLWASCQTAVGGCGKLEFRTTVNGGDTVLVMAYALVGDDAAGGCNRRNACYLPTLSTKYYSPNDDYCCNDEACTA